MAVWKIEPSWKKSIIERMYFSKDNNTLVVETGWRWGSFECETEDVLHDVSIGNPTRRKSHTIGFYESDYESDIEILYFGSISS